MEFALLGFPEDRPTLDLDHRRFSYAGKFVMSHTGKAVVTDDGLVVAAVSFSEDRTEPEVMWLRYLTVRAERRGEKIGPRLSIATRERILDRGYEGVRIAVNNPFAYHALYRAGFAYLHRETGLAELVLGHPASGDRATYRAGLEVFREREDLGAEERTFLESHLGGDPPDQLEVPVDWFEDE